MNCCGNVINFETPTHILHHIGKPKRRKTNTHTHARARTAAGMMKKKNTGKKHKIDRDKTEYAFHFDVINRS